MFNYYIPRIPFSYKRCYGIMQIISMLLLIIYNLSNFGHAQQTSFNKSISSFGTEFSYEWRHQDTEYQLNFAIDNAILYSMPPSPANYSQQIFQDNIYRKVMLAATKIDATLGNIKVKRNHTGLTFNVTSRHSKQARLILDKLKLIHEQAQDDYWRDNFFIKYNSPTGADGIRHDHAKYTSLSSQSLVPVVKAIKNLQSNSSDPREFIQIALGWIQSIPYNRLEDRLSSNGAGFVSPRDLIVQNQGDCDSKSTLMAALIKAYNQNIDVQMVLLPKHALLAVAVRADEDEMTLQYKGNEYVLLEPTGPAQLSIGTVADTSKLSLRNRQYDLSTM